MEDVEQPAPSTDAHPQSDAVGSSGSTEDKPPFKILGMKPVTALKLLAVILLITFIVLGLTVWDLDDRLRDLLEWLDDNRAEGIAIYIALYAALTGVPYMLSFMSGTHIS